MQWCTILYFAVQYMYFLARLVCVNKLIWRKTVCWTLAHLLINPNWHYGCIFKPFCILYDRPQCQNQELRCICIIFYLLIGRFYSVSEVFCVRNYISKKLNIFQKWLNLTPYTAPKELSCHKKLRDWPVIVLWSAYSSFVNKLLLITFL